MVVARPLDNPCATLTGGLPSLLPRDCFCGKRKLRKDRENDGRDGLVLSPGGLLLIVRKVAAPMYVTLPTLENVLMGILLPDLPITPGGR